MEDISQTMINVDCPLTFCISTYNNLEYLKIAIDSVRKNSYYKNAPFIIHAENCTDGTNEWLIENYEKYSLTLSIEPKNNPVKGIGGGMNECARLVQTKYIMFLHSDFYVTKNWDLELYLLAESRIEIGEKVWVNSHRIEPKMFENSTSRPGTVIVPQEMFGSYYDDFNTELFDQWAKAFNKTNSVLIPKGEGVSGLIVKKHWDEIGGNDPRFAPASYDDMDLFLRMIHAGYKFYLTSKSIVWHFGARGSHRLEENDGKSSTRQTTAEQKNLQKWLEKWKGYPKFNEYGMIEGVQ